MYTKAMAAPLLDHKASRRPLYQAVTLRGVSCLRLEISFIVDYNYPARCSSGKGK